MLRDLLNKNAYTVALLGLLVALSYYNALFTPFMWDDKTLVVSNTGLKGGWEGLLAAFSPRLWGLRVDNEAFRSIYRPLHTVLSMIDYRIWGLNPFGFHPNVILHSSIRSSYCACPCGSRRRGPRRSPRPFSPSTPRIPSR